MARLLRTLVLLCLLVGCRVLGGGVERPPVAGIACATGTAALQDPAVLEGPVRPLDPQDAAIWLDLNLRLSALFAPAHAVTVRRVPQQAGWLGLTRRQADGSFEILVGDAVGRTLLATVLIHEWAHVAAWATEQPWTPHGSVWGLLFARGYRSAMRTS